MSESSETGPIDVSAYLDMFTEQLHKLYGESPHEKGDAMYHGAKSTSMSEEEYKEFHHRRKVRTLELVRHLKDQLDILSQGVEARDTGAFDENDEDNVYEKTADRDSQFRQLSGLAIATLESVKDYFSWSTVQSQWASDISAFSKEMGAEGSTDELLSNNIFGKNDSEYAIDNLSLGDYGENGPSYGTFLEMLILKLNQALLSTVTNLVIHTMNANDIRSVDKIFDSEIEVESYAEAAMEFLKHPEAFAAIDFSISDAKAEEIHTSLLTIEWMTKRLNATLQALPLGKGEYKVNLSDVESHVPTNSFQPRKTFENLGMWPLSRNESWQSLSELDLNNWIGPEQHSQRMDCSGSLHKILYRDFIDFIQSIGYQHKKVTGYDEANRVKPSLKLFSWDERDCKYRADATLFFYNAACPISQSEMRIAVTSDSQFSFSMTIHAGLELFGGSASSEGNDSLQVREKTEQFVKQLFEEFDEYQRQNGLLKNSKFDAGTILQLQTKKRSFDDMILTSSKKQLLDDNIFALLSNSSRLVERGVETNRGVMLAGPPGVGKSLTIDAIISEADCTVVFTNFASLSKIMDEIFNLSRRYAPTILILEDIDALGITNQRGEFGSGAGLSTLLNHMDGISNNNGVITVATSNHPENLDWALIARPGRFDVRIDYPYPDKAMLLSILKLKLKPFPCDSKLNLDVLVDTMPLGFTGSHIHDIVNQANYISVNNSKKGARDIVVTQESLASATERSLYNFKKFLDERPHVVLQNPPTAQEVLKGKNSNNSFFQ